MSTPDSPIKRMRLRYAGTCRSCTAPVPAGAWAVYDRPARTIECLACADQRVEPGMAGASARREYERRVARREQQVRKAHPRLGGLILALSDDPQSTRARARGARGEELLGRRLDALTDRGVRVLHDRRIPGTHGNIDHIAVSASGIFVIDAKHYKGRPQLRVHGGILRRRTEALLVGSRDRTKLVDGVAWQVTRVRAAIAHIDAVGAVAVRGLLCFVNADWPLIGGAFTIGGIDVLWPKKATDQITAAPSGDPVPLDKLHSALAAAFPPS